MFRAVWVLLVDTDELVTLKIGRLDLLPASFFPGIKLEIDPGVRSYFT